jgi:DNA-binding transcriptional LysR family regulator
MFEQSLQCWGIKPIQLPVALILSSSEMVKAVVESGVGAAAIPAMMVTNELKLGTLHAVQIVDDRVSPPTFLSIIQPILRLKHQQRFQTQTIIAFEQILAH